MDDFLDTFQPLVRRIAKGLVAANPRLRSEFDDLMQVGMIRLWESCGKYDADRLETFIIYLRVRIRGAMIDYLRTLGFFQIRSEKVKPWIRDSDVSSDESILGLIPAPRVDDVRLDEDLIDAAFPKLDARKKAVVFGLLDGYTRTEIAAILEVTYTCIFAILRNIRKKHPRSRAAERLL